MAEDRVLRAARTLDDETLLALVDGLEDDARRSMAGSLQLSAGAFAKAKSPAEMLVRSLRRLPPPTRADVGSVLTARCLEDVVERLGDDADEPTRDQLLAVLPEVIEEHGLDVTRLMLAATAGSDAPARQTCADVFDTDERFAVDDAAATEPAPVAPKKELDAAELAQREQERERRREEKKARKHARKRTERHQDRAEQAKRDRIRAAKRRERADAVVAEPEIEEPLEPITVPEHLLVAYARDEGVPGTEPDVASQVPEDADERVERPVTEDGLVTLNARVEERPSVKLQGSYDHLLDDDPLIGAVVVASIPRPGGGGIKKQPAVVIAATPYQLIVRPCLGEHERKPDDDVSLPLADWAGAGFKEPAYVVAHEAVVARRGVHDELGYLSGRDWNLLL